MSQKKAIVAGGLVGLPFVIAFAGLMSAHTLCACTSVEDNFQIFIGASPIRDPDAFRVNLLRKLPPGSTTDEIYLVLGSIARGGGGDREDIMVYMKKKCVTESVELQCRFVLETQWWGYKEIGFDLYLILDGANRLKDARVSPYSVWGRDRA